MNAIRRYVSTIFIKKLSRLFRRQVSLNLVAMELFDTMNSYRFWRQCIGVSLMLLGTSCYNLEDDEYPVTSDPADFPTSEWEKVSSPSAYGWSEDSLRGARKYAEDIGSNAVIVVDQGRLIAAWGKTKEKYYVASVRKSYLSTLFGAYVEDGTISLDATLEDYGIDDISPALTSAEKRARVKDLLASTSGVYRPAAAADGEEGPERGSKHPGQYFYYNNWDFNALGTIFEERTGKGVFQAFADQIAIPLGMEDFNFQTDGRYEFIKESIHPAYHFDMSARDMARFGLLLLRQGQWEGRELVSEKWIAESTRKHVDFDTIPGSNLPGGYGYMWWINSLAEAGLVQRDFSAQGNFTQAIFILPNEGLVIIHRGRLNSFRRIGGTEVIVLMQKILAARTR